MFSATQPRSAPTRSQTVILLAVLVATISGSERSIEIHGVDGRMLRPFEPSGAANVLFFIATDCPVSNAYAPEIQGICKDYEARGVTCMTFYDDLDNGSDPISLDEDVRRHRREYGY